MSRTKKRLLLYLVVVSLVFIYHSFVTTTFKVPSFVLDILNEHVLSQHKLTVFTDSLSFNLSNGILNARSLRVKHKEHDSHFIFIDNIDLKFTAPLTLGAYFSDSPKIDIIDCDGLFVDPLSYSSASESTKLSADVIIANRISVKNISFKLMEGIFDLEDFVFKLTKIGQKSHASLDYAKDPIGGSIAIEASIDHKTLDITLNTHWKNDNFALFAPLALLKYYYGLSIKTGSAAIDLNWNGNLQRAADITVPELLDLFNSEITGTINVTDCNIDYMENQLDLAIDLIKKDATPWSGLAKLAMDDSRIDLLVGWPLKNHNKTTVLLELDGKNIKIDTQKLAKMGVALSFTPGSFDILGELKIDHSNITGFGSLTAYDFIYEDIILDRADIDWKIDESTNLLKKGKVISNLGDITFTSKTAIAGDDLGKGTLEASFENLNMAYIPIDIIEEGTAKGVLSLKYDFLDLENLDYSLDFTAYDSKIYLFSQAEIKSKLTGKWDNWKLHSPSVIIKDGSTVSVDGTIGAEGFDCKTNFSNIPLSYFNLEEEITKGNVFCKASLTGALAEPHLKGELWGNDIELFGQNLESVKSRATIKSNIVTFSPLVIDLPTEGVVDGYAIVNLSDGSFDTFRLNFQAFDISFFKPFLPANSPVKTLSGGISGNLSYAAQGGLNHWEVSCTGRSIFIDSNELLSLNLEAAIYKGQGELKSLFVRGFGGTISLNGQFFSTDHFEGAIEANSLDLSKIDYIENVLPGLQGKLDCQGTVDWIKDSKSGNLTVYGTNIVFEDTPLGNFGANLVIDNYATRILTAEFDKLGLTCDGALFWLHDNPYNLTVNFSDADLSFVGKALKIGYFEEDGLVVTGKCALKGYAASIIPDRIELALDTLTMRKDSDLIVANRPINLIYENDSIDIASLELKYRQGVLGITGSYKDNSSYDLKLSGEKFSLSAIGRLLKLPNFGYDGELSLDGTIKGSTLQPNLELNAQINQLSFLDKVIPSITASLTYSPTELLIEDATVSLPLSCLRLSGKIDVRDYFDFYNADLLFNFPKAPIKDFVEYFPEIFREADGSMSAKIALRGAILSPEISGELEMLANKINFVGLRETFSDGTIKLSTVDQIINIDSFSWRLGKGALSGGGIINFRDGLGLLDASFSAKNIDFSYMNLEVNNASASAEVSGDFYNPILRANIYLPRGRFNISTDLLQTRKPLAVPFKTFDYRVAFDVPGNFWLRSSFLNAEMKGKFSIFGDLETFKMDGLVDCNQGNLFFQRRQFKIEEGGINFGGVDGIFDPHFVLKSNGQIQNTKVFLALQGRISSFTPRLYSSPPMSEGDLLALLAVGRDLSSLTQSDSEQSFESQIFDSLKNTYISSLVGDTLSTALNLDELFLSSLYDKTTGKTRSYIRAGKYVAEKIFVAYEGTLDESENETYIFEYRLPRGFVINLEFKEPEKEKRIGIKYDWRFW